MTDYIEALKERTREFILIESETLYQQALRKGKLQGCTAVLCFLDNVTINCGETYDTILNGGKTYDTILNGGKTYDTILNGGKANGTIIDGGKANGTIIDGGEAYNTIIRDGKATDTILSDVEIKDLLAVYSSKDRYEKEFKPRVIGSGCSLCIGGGEYEKLEPRHIA